MAIKFLNSVNGSSTLFFNGADDNSGKADFAVKATGSNSGTAISLRSGQFQFGGDDINYEFRMDSYSTTANVRSWSRDIYIRTQSGSTSHHIAFVTADLGTDTEKMRITGDGKVGIGTTSPVGKLHLYGDSGDAWDRHLYLDFGGTDIGAILTDGDGMKFRNLTVGNGFHFRNSSNSTGLYINDSNNVAVGNTNVFTTGGTAKLSVVGNQISLGLSNTDLAYFRRLSAGNFQWQTYNGGNSGNIHLQPYGGNVGIGTTSVSDGDLSINDPRLHVRGIDTAGAYSLVARFQAGSDANDTGAAIAINHSNDRGLLIKAGRKDSDRPVAFFDLIDSNGSTTNMLTMGEYGSDFRVGIGTTSPAALLDVNGTAQMSTGITENTHYVGVSVQHWGDGGTGMYFNTDQVDFRTASVERMRITSGGNVGIGTTSPAYKLDVSGDIRSTAAVRANTNLIVGGYTDISGYINHRDHLRVVNKLQNNWIAWAVRDTTASEVVMDLTNIGSINASGALTFSNYGAGYLKSDASGNITVDSSVIEDTLDSVTDRGSTTTNSVAFGTTTKQTNTDLTVDGAIKAGAKTTYNKGYPSLDTTGNAVAGLVSSFNGASAMFIFTCYGHTGSYQRIVYSCWNTSGTSWNVKKVIDEGNNQFDITVDAVGATRTFTFVSRSGTASYSPNVNIEHVGAALDTSYLA